MKPASIAGKYAAAFASGYIGALLPVLSTGVWPGPNALIAAIAAGLLATGLFHCPGPTAPPTESR